MKIIKKINSNMSLNVIGALVSMLLVFGFAVCLIGNRCIVNAFKNEYSTVTYHMADAVASFVNGDHIEDYLAGKETEEYTLTKRRIDIAAQKLNVSLIYVIRVDTSDYGRFVSVFNAVDNTVDNTSYSVWELGYKRDTTNEEYRAKYRSLYEHKSDYETLFRLNTSDGALPHITTIIPIENRAGDVTALMCVQRPIREMAEAFAPYYLLIVIGVLVMVALIGFVTAVFIRKYIIKPVDKVSREANRFAKENTKGEPLGDISKYDVMLSLAHSIDSMETDMVKYIENISAITAEKERIGAELSIAAEIQANSLPDVFPPFPDRHEFDIYASMEPAKEVGGDFYNFLMPDKDHLAMVIADVSGKGVPAALFMMVASILISNRVEVGGTPAEILSVVNEKIFEHNRSDMFVTVWLGILEISTGRLIAANAGHEYPAVYRKDKSFELVQDKHGFVVGGMKGIKYKDYELQLNKGDKLFLYTDGLPEATDSGDNMLTYMRMIDALNKYKAQSPRGIIEGVKDSVNKFVGDAPQFDDLTMLCLEIKE